MTILKEQVLAVTDRSKEYKEASDYYDGRVAEVFSTVALRRAMRASGYASRLNFCRPIVDAVQNRLEISAVLGVSDTAQSIIDQAWEENELFLYANEAHRGALTYGDYYALVWPDEEGNVEVSFNTPLTTALVYDPESPRKKLYAVKMWELEDSTRMNIYYPDRIDKYRTQGTQVTEGAQWTLFDSVENPFGEVPVFHFRAGAMPFGRPEHKDAYDAQNYINKQFITSMFVTDYQGAPQRYALSRAGSANEVTDFEEGDTERENLSALQNGPGKLWYMTDVDSVGQFDPAQPSVFWDPIKDTIRAMASVTYTPLHYFEKTGNIPSGEALRVAEAPLIKKVHDRQVSFGQSWRHLFKFILKVNGIEEDVEIKWHDVESLDELERLDAALKKRNIGLSIAQTMRESGYDQEVIDRVLEEAKAERDGNLAGYQRAPETRVQPQNDARNVDATTSANGL